MAAALAIVGMRNRREESPLDERLNEYISRGEEVTLEEIELSQPITERVIVPIVQKIGELTQRFTPQNILFRPQKTCSFVAQTAFQTNRRPKSAPIKMDLHPFPPHFFRSFKPP